MKTLPLFFLCVCALAQVPSAPTNLRVVTTPPVETNIIYLDIVTGANNPLALPLAGNSAWWKPAPVFPQTNFGGVFLSNVWTPEASSDGVNWNLPLSPVAYISQRTDRVNQTALPQWHYVETGPNWTVRIRKQPPIKIQ